MCDENSTVSEGNKRDAIRHSASGRFKRLQHAAPINRAINRVSGCVAFLTFCIFDPWLSPSPCQRLACRSDPSPGPAACLHRSLGALRRASYSSFASLKWQESREQMRKTGGQQSRGGERIRVLVKTNQNVLSMNKDWSSDPKPLPSLTALWRLVFSSQLAFSTSTLLSLKCDICSDQLRGSMQTLSPSAYQAANQRRVPSLPRSMNNQ